jgi:hypothetical protein
LEEEVIVECLTYLRANNDLYKLFTLMHDHLRELKESLGYEADVTLAFRRPDSGPGDLHLQGNVHAPPVAENEQGALFLTRGYLVSAAMCVHRRGKMIDVSPLNHHRDALSYPLAFPKGENGWRPGIPHVGPNRTNTRNTLTFRQYARYIFQRRNPLSFFLTLDPLAQQMLIDYCCRALDMDLEFIKNQLPQELMMAARHDIVRVLEETAARNGLNFNLDVGKSFLLPKSHPGSMSHHDMEYNNMFASIYVI